MTYRAATSVVVLRSLTLLSAQFAFAGVAVAQEPVQSQEPPPTSISPPIAESDMAVPYPAGAQGEASVLLDLVVETDGTVASAVVFQGTDPFAEAARTAAQSWRFSPARRGDQPVAARIRARVDFQPSPPPSPPASDVAPSPSAQVSPPAAPETPLDVTVRGTRREIGQTTLLAADVRELPGAFGDPFRAVEALPGVTPIVSGLPYFYVRGAPPNDSGYTVDGIRIPTLFHLGIGQGVLHPALIEQVNFFPSAAPAAHGGVVGGIIAAETLAPRPIAHAEANLRLIDAGGLVESPWGNGRGSVLLAGRYGYPGPILGAITPGLALSYWDYQARATWRISDRGTLGLFAFGGHDLLATPSPSQDPTAPAIEQLASDFHRLDLRYSHELGDGHLRLAVTGGYDRQGVAPTYITDRSAGARLEVEQRLTPNFRLRGGAGARVDKYGFNQKVGGPGEALPVPSSADPPPTNLTGGVHLDAVWRLGSRVEIVPGARLDVFASSKAPGPADAARVRTSVPAFDPRLSARVTITPSVAWLSGFGIAHQYPALSAGDIPAPLFSVPGFASGNRQLQAVMQVTQGAEVVLPAEITTTATGFVSRWSGLVDLTTATCFLAGDPPAYQCPSDQPVRGYAYGVEVLARRALSRRLAGWLSYTLSRSTRQTHFVSPAGIDTLVTVPSEFNRTHVLNAALTLDLGRRWRFGARSLFYSGTPYSRLENGFAVPPYNAYRNPNFFRLDVRFEKRWSLGKTGSLAFVVEGQNITLSTEFTSFGRSCMSSPGSPTECTVTHSEIGPITIPSVGLEAVF